MADEENEFESVGVFAEDLKKYLERITEAGLSGATLKNRTSYCVQFLEFVAQSRQGVKVPTVADVSAFTSMLWMKRATDSTIKSKLSEALRFVRWISAERSVPFRDVEAAEIFEKVRLKNPNRR